MNLSRWDSNVRNPDYTQKRKSKSSGLVFDRDVGCTVFVSFVLVGLVMAGAAIAAIANRQFEGLKHDALFAGGIIVCVAAVVAFGFYVYALERYFYRPEVVEEYWKDTEVEQPARYVAQVATNTWRRGRYEWTELQWQQLAERCWHKGEWAGGARMTRKLFASIVKDLNKNYPIIFEDFKDWGFVDSMYNWLEDGRAAIKEHLV